MPRLSTIDPASQSPTTPVASGSCMRPPVRNRLFLTLPEGSACRLGALIWSGTTVAFF